MIHNPHPHRKQEKRSRSHVKASRETTETSPNQNKITHLSTLHLQTCVLSTLQTLSASLDWFTVMVSYHCCWLHYTVLPPCDKSVPNHWKNKMNTSYKRDKKYKWYTIPTSIVDKYEGQGHMSILQQRPLTPLKIQKKSLTSAYSTCKPVSHEPC